LAATRSSARRSLPAWQRVSAATMANQPLPQSTPIAMMAKLTVWYNTKCPVCDYGITRQRRRLEQAAASGGLEFRDINFEPDALVDFGASVEDVRRRLHGVDDLGQYYVGADCVREIWLRTPGDAWLGRLLKLPPIARLARVFYDGLAALLYRWNRRKRHW
jgi:predicted DCC family thiol-disulfide oxidoreductase YuxK